VLLVLDTSIVLKWYKEEEYTEIALKIKKDFVEGLNEIIFLQFCVW
jgi:predicted nucleic acid-binding protein